MDLIRELMLDLEGEVTKDLSNYDKPTILYHKALIKEAGFAKGAILEGDDQIKAVYLLRLTWEGHEFLDAARDETGWRHVTQVIGQTVGTVSLSLLQALLNQWAAGKIGLS